MSSYCTDYHIVAANSNHPTTTSAPPGPPPACLRGQPSRPRCGSPSLGEGGWLTPITGQPVMPATESRGATPAARQQTQPWDCHSLRRSAAARESRCALPPSPTPPTAQCWLTRHVCAQLLGHHEQEVDDVLRLPRELGAQHRVLRQGGRRAVALVEGGRARRGGGSRLRPPLPSKHAQ